MDHNTQHPSPIVFFDLETIYPTCVIVEFGAILICPNTLTELRNYSTLVRPPNPSLIPAVFERSNGINRDSLAEAPTFADIADTVYELLHDRIWAGHNILTFDRIHIRNAFNDIKRPPPEPKAIIDSFPLLTKTFGRRAGDMKMDTLARYFDLGPQTHRSLDDVRMNLRVIKYCATVLFLESSLVDASTVNNSWNNSADAAATSHGSEICLPDVGSSSDIPHRQHFFTFGPFRDETSEETIQAQMFSSDAVLSEASTIIFAVLKLDEISVPCLTASLVQSDSGDDGDIPKIQLLHKGVPFQLRCDNLKILLGIDGKFSDPHTGRRILSFVVDLRPSQTLCKVLEACDDKAQRKWWLSFESDNSSSSDWRPLVVTRKDGFFNYPTMRLQIPTAECGDAAIYAAEIYKRESSGSVKRLVFDKFDVEELGWLFKAGTFVDAVLSLDSYDYQKIAGIRLIVKGLIIHSN